MAFFTYSETAQESCLRLMGKKLVVSLAMEGKLHTEGLQTMEEDDDLLTAMARELVTRQGVGERAAQVWKALPKVRGSGTSRVSVIEESPISQPIEVSNESEEPKIWAPSKGTSVQLSLF